MVFSIVKQSVDIRLRLALEKTPKLSADTECVVSIGMLAKMAGLAIPERKEKFEEMVADLKKQTETLANPSVITQTAQSGDRMQRLKEILFAYEPKGGMDDEKYELVGTGMSRNKVQVDESRELACDSE